MEDFILANVTQFPNVSFSSCLDTFCSICMKHIDMIPSDATYLSFPKSTLEKWNGNLNVLISPPQYYSVIKA